MSQLTATVYPKNCHDKSHTWSSENEAVAIVDSHGNVDEVGVGTTRIYATHKDGHKDYCEVTVIDGGITVTGFKVTSSMAIARGVWSETAEKYILAYNYPAVQSGMVPIQIEFVPANAVAELYYELSGDTTMITTSVFSSMQYIPSLGSKAGTCQVRFYVKKKDGTKLYSKPVEITVTI